MPDIDITVVSGSPVYVDIVTYPIDLALSSGDTTTVIVTSGDSINLDVVSGATALVSISPVGVQGPPGPTYGVPTFIQSGAPTAAQYSGFTSYAWWQTGSGDLTLWIEDGL